MEIKASQVKELRELSGVGMMECKKALVEVEGDIEKLVQSIGENIQVRRLATQEFDSPKKGRDLSSF